jgi:hypothetical protein
MRFGLKPMMQGTGSDAARAGARVADEGRPIADC